jgi:hypothetical protein
MATGIGKNEVTLRKLNTKVKKKRRLITTQNSTAEAKY